MKGIGREVVMIFFVAIVLYLLLNNGTQTTALVNGAGGQIANIAAVLQGRGSAGSSGANTGSFPGVPFATG